MPQPASMSSTVDFPEVSIFSFFAERRDGTFPSDKVLYQSVASPKTTLNKDTILETAARLSTALQTRLSFQRDTVLALCTPNAIDIPIINLAVWHAGGAITPINPASTSGEISRQLKDSGANLIVSHANCLDVVTKATREADILDGNILLCGDAPCSTRIPIKHWRSILPEPHEPVLPPCYISSPKTTTALVPYSSGTTGLPKGIVLTHYNIISNLIQSNVTFSTYVSWSGGPAHTTRHIPPAAPYDPSTNEGGDVMLAVLPMYHIYGIMVHVLKPLQDGTKSVIDDTGLRWDPFRYSENIHRFKVTMGYIVPPMALGLLKAGAAKPDLKAKWSSLRMLLSAAAPMGKETVESLWNQLGLRTIQAFGMSEASPSLFQTPWEKWWEGRGGVGFPLPGVEVKLLKIKPAAHSDDEQAVEEEAKEGEEGELAVRGPNVFKAYLNQSASAAPPVSSSGWFRTGDIALRSPETGMYYITDRLKELIKYKGFPVAPAELEAVLLACDIVEDVAVLPVWDERQGTEVPRAYVVRRGGRSAVKHGDEELIVRFLGGRVAGYKALRGGVRWIEAVPRSAAGKILRRLLKEEQQLKGDKARL